MKWRMLEAAYGVVLFVGREVPPAVVAGLAVVAVAWGAVVVKRAWRGSGEGGEDGNPRLSAGG